MPALNLQQIINGDDVSTMINKLNNNFSLLMSIGGGPQGKLGRQGTPGLPGLRGYQGHSGDNGEDGQNVTLIQDDENWGVIYKGIPNTLQSADAAVELHGFDVGDIWVDNVDGIFYVIREDVPGSYVFKPYPISPSSLEIEQQWINDTSYSLASDSAQQGLRISNRFATVSITTSHDEESVVIEPGSTAAYTQLTEPDAYVGGYQRPAYKLSIDHEHYKGVAQAHLNVSRISSFVDQDSESNYLVFGTTDNIYAPLLYLDSSNKNTGFGILHSSFDTMDISDISILAIRSDEENSIVIADVDATVHTGYSHTFTSVDINDNQKIVSLIDVLPDGTTLGNSERNLWFSLSTASNGNTPIVGSNRPIPTIGMVINSAIKVDENDNDYTKGKVEFYVHDRLGTSSREAVLSSGNTPNDMILRLCTNTGWLTSGLTVGSAYGGRYISDGAVIENNVVIGDYTEFNSWPYSSILDNVNNSRLTIAGGGGYFAFGSKVGDASYGLAHTLDDNAARIQTNSTEHGIILGNEGHLVQDTAFNGRSLYIQPGGNIGVGISGNPTDYTNIFRQRLVVRKNEQTNAQGLQILGYEHVSTEDSGFQFRTDADDNGQIYQGSNRDISIWSNHVRHVVMKPDGGTKLSKGSVDDIVSGNATLELLGNLNGITNEAETSSSITFGVLRNNTDNPTIPVNAELHTEFSTPDKVCEGIMYQGFNAWYDEDDQTISYRSNPGDISNDSNGAGNMLFNTNRGSFHITSHGADADKVKKHNTSVTSIPSFI